LTVGDRVVVAWWTAANNRPRGSVVFSNDAGDTFGSAVRVDSKSAEG
jgi:predicted GNAT superfamily acetyltransferase